MINLKVRLKNPVFWVNIITSIVTTVLIYNSLTPDSITTWESLFALITGVFANPYLIFKIIVDIWNSVYDPTTAGVSDSTAALEYDKPKEG